MADIRLMMTADAAGGIWTYALDMAGALAERGIGTTLAVLGPRPQARALQQAQSIADLDIELTDLPLDWTADSGAEVRQAGEKIAQLARQRQADIIQLNAPALAAGATFPVPVLGFLHSSVATWWEAVHGNSALPADLSWRAELTRAGLERVDAALAPSQALATQAQQIYSLAAAPVVVHNGRAAPKTRGSSTERDVLVLTAGRLWDEGKNVATLDRAARRVPFAVHAAGPLQGPNGASASLHHLRWTGALEAAVLQDLMHRSAVFVSCAVYEPFGLAVLEAAQAGCALVLSDIPTFRELWDGAALFVAAHDEHGLAQVLMTLSEDAGLRIRLAAEATRRAERYTVAKSADRLAGVMHSLLRAAEPRRRAS